MGFLTSFDFQKDNEIYHRSPAEFEAKPNGLRKFYRALRDLSNELAGSLLSLRRHREMPMPHRRKVKTFDRVESSINSSNPSDACSEFSSKLVSPKLFKQTHNSV